MKKNAFIILMIFLTGQVWSQSKEAWTVLFIEKGQTLEEYSSYMHLVRPTGFYLYENCTYNMTFINGQNLTGRLVKVSQDTLFFTNFFNQNVALKAHSSLDTLPVSCKTIETMHMRTGSKLILRNYNISFQKDSVGRIFPSSYKKLFKNDTTLYELAPYFVNYNIHTIFEVEGNLYYYNGRALLNKPLIPENSLGYTTKNFLWFIPNEVEEINGIAVGAWAENFKNDEINERDSLLINGLNIEVNPLILFSLVAGVWYHSFPDSLEYYNLKVKNYYSTTKNGVNLSILGSFGSERINGVNIAGINNVVDKICGVSITGINNFAYITKGLNISLIRNRSTLTRGVQLGLFNKTMDLRGVQIGLWNKNGKRSLPFINWQFGQ